MGGGRIHLETLALFFPMAPSSFMNGTYPLLNAHRPPDATGAREPGKERESVASQSGFRAYGVLGAPARRPLSCPELTSDLTNRLLVPEWTPLLSTWQSQSVSLSESGDTGPL